MTAALAVLVLLPAVGGAVLLLTGRRADRVAGPMSHGEHRQLEIATALGRARSTGVSTISRLLNKHEDVIEQLLGPERAETVLGAICRELKLDMSELVRTAKKAGDDDAVAAARARVQLAKTGLGERGTAWWEQSDDERRTRWEEALRSLGG